MKMENARMHAQRHDEQMIYFEELTLGDRHQLRDLPSGSVSLDCRCVCRHCLRADSTYEEILAAEKMPIGQLGKHLLTRHNIRDLQDEDFAVVKEE